MAESDRSTIYSREERSEQVLNAYKKAFAGFSSEEMLLLDGIILEPEGRPDESGRGRLRAHATSWFRQSVCGRRGADTRVCRVETRLDAGLVRYPG